jgi:hypothetical protein
MRKAATAILILILSGLASMAAPKPADQSWTMDDVIDRVITKPRIFSSSNR